MVMNNDLTRPYTPDEITRALQQMHPLKSPGSDEAFSNMISKAETEGRIEGVVVSRRTPKIFHLLFVDDTLIFCQATPDALHCVKDILSEFEASTRLKINNDKSAMVFNKNVEASSRTVLADILNFETEGILSKVLGQKYFSETNFFEARLGSSCTWHSLLATRELLVAGLRWEIGDGRSVPIVGHPWLPRPLSFQLICKPKALADNTRVVALLSSDSEWNKRLVEDEFSPLDAECILGIKLKGNGVSDSLVWHYESHSRFIVGSAYRVAQEQGKWAGSSLPASSWKFIWISKAPPKVLMFAWRCARDALPTLANLGKRGIDINEGCYGCLATEEDTELPFARLVWAISDLQWSAINSWSSSSEEWLRMVYNEIRGPDYDYFLALCWAIWGGEIGESLKVLSQMLQRLFGLLEDALGNLSFGVSLMTPQGSCSLFLASGVVYGTSGKPYFIPTSGCRLWEAIFYFDFGVSLMAPQEHFILTSVSLMHLKEAVFYSDFGCRLWHLKEAIFGSDFGVSLMAPQGSRFLFCCSFQRMM
ncbi:UNVERIFIED_CONTAM: hypothetical protein Slati_3129900 [Sesamum latifolium]|uniref:Reverse transcriptase zinc-binding domain-containing protein n=1 Tax=Sesamum latifolium TaxID=2727402 RepID=A0AAW2UVX1_9LAMI